MHELSVRIAVPNDIVGAQMRVSRALTQETLKCTTETFRGLLPQPVQIPESPLGLPDAFEKRSRFASVPQTIAELASRPQNIEALQNAGVMALLRPLLLDTVPSIQQSAALALGRLANYSEALAEAVVMNEVLPQLVYSLSDQNVRFSDSSSFLFLFSLSFFPLVYPAHLLILCSCPFSSPCSAVTA